MASDTVWYCQDVSCVKQNTVPETNLCWEHAFFYAQSAQFSFCRTAYPVLTGVIRSDSSRLEIYTSELGYPTHWQQTLEDRTCIVPKKAYAGSSTQWLTEMHEMGSGESSLILSHLWSQSHGQRAVCSLRLWGCCVPSLGCVNMVPGHIYPDKPWRLYNLCARKVLQRSVTDFRVSSKGHVLTPKCLSLPIPPH